MSGVIFLQEDIRVVELRMRDLNHRSRAAAGSSLVRSSESYGAGHSFSYSQSSGAVNVLNRKLTIVHYNLNSSLKLV